MYEFVDVTEDMKKVATEKAKILGENVGAKTEDLNPERDYIGVLGELAFMKYLEDRAFKRGIDYEYDEVVSGKYGDSWDFKFVETCQTVDVKSSKRHYDLFIRDDMWLKKPCTFYVQIVLWGNDRACLVGYADHKMIKRRKPKLTPILFNRVVHERFLKSVNQLLSKI